MRFVVDSNVAIAANGYTSNASAECGLKAIDFLEALIMKGRLVLDVSGEIEARLRQPGDLVWGRAEYSAHLSFGQPGVGNRFIEAFLTTAATRVERIELGRDQKGNYVDFPSAATLKNFDLSDRKFAALSRKSKAPVANAVDSDWLYHKVELGKYGVKIHFLCGCDMKNWFATAQ